jgi:hypothetical protein
MSIMLLAAIRGLTGMRFLRRFSFDIADLKRVSVITLILVNLFPILGVLFLGWEVFSVLFLFWTENVIIGATNVIKMILAAPDDKFGQASKIFMIPFFCVHYGMFTFVHGIIIIVLFGGSYSKFADVTDFPDALRIIVTQDLGWAVLALAASHVVSLITNYIGKREYKESSLGLLMGQPYGRVMILHLAIIIGGLLLGVFGSPMAGTVLLILVKTFIDLMAHLSQHRIGNVSNPDKVVTVGS